MSVEQIEAAYGEEREQLIVKIEIMTKALQQYADPENWGYYDESGCDKGHGKYTEACFIGPEIARAALNTEAQE